MVGVHQLREGEDTALVLSSLALVQVWKQWKVWSPSSVSACLQMNKGRLHVLSCYAPIRAVSREDKKDFFQNLDTIIFSILAEEKYVLLADFNAWV